MDETKPPGRPMTEQELTSADLDFDPNETDPVVRYLRELRESTRRIAIATIVLFIVIVSCFTAALILRGNDLEERDRKLQTQANELKEANGRLRTANNKLKAVTTENRAAIVLLCDVTVSLDAVLLAAADQIRANFRNGTYTRLLGQGILTEENIEAARQTERRYRETHKKLQNPTACVTVEPQ